MFGIASVLNNTTNLEHCLPENSVLAFASTPGHPTFNEENIVTNNKKSRVVGSIVLFVGCSSTCAVHSVDVVKSVTLRTINASQMQMGIYGTYVTAVGPSENMG